MLVIVRLRVATNQMVIVMAVVIETNYVTMNKYWSDSIDLRLFVTLFKVCMCVRSLI